MSGVRDYYGYAAAAVFLVGLLVVAWMAVAETWRTNFEMRSIDMGEIISGGPPKDGIPSIDAPKFGAIESVSHLADTEPVVSVIINGDARAYTLQVLMWYEIVNDSVGGVPVSVTFCPLYNAAVVFDRRLDDMVLDFGTTGILPNSDLVMYDRQAERWWQQFIGEAIVGDLTGKTLKMIPSRLESFAKFRGRAHGGKVLVPNEPGRRSYGANPYTKYDSSLRPFLYRGQTPKGIAPLARVVTVESDSGGREAWALDVVRDKKRIETSGGLVVTWEAGQNSALDSGLISEGVDVGNVIVQRKTSSGLEGVVYGVDFAFAFHAFYPESPIHTR
tara:strand:- start:247 stop:1239 length:993 start_codon:yes stop_codon:yes gene_type:complete